MLNSEIHEQEGDTIGVGDRYATVVNSGQSTLKALLTMNGGASIAFLAFIGQAIEHKAITEAAAKSFTSAMQWFIYGTFFAVLSYGCIFLTNCLSYEKNQKEQKGLRTLISDNGIYLAFFVTLGLGLISFFAFLWASWRAVEGFRSAGTSLVTG